MGLFGPKSRELIEAISKDNFSNERFKFGTGKLIKINSKFIWAQRLSYVGELGYELYIENNDAKEIYKLINKGQKKHISLWIACNGYHENGEWFFTLGS